MNQYSFMTGIDYVDENFTLPLRWVAIAGVLVAIPLVAGARYKMVLIILAASLGANVLIPGVVRSVYVRPNELELEKPYIERHIEATTHAFGLQERATEQPFTASREEMLDVNAHATLVDNIRLWDWRAFSDTITQIQALRPYYRFADVDIDRYIIDGKIKQVLLSPREIDVNQLPVEARASWINPHFVYTHGYGVGDVGGEPYDRRRPSRVVNPRRPPRGQDCGHQTGPLGDLLRGVHPRPRVRYDGSKRVRLPVGRPKHHLELRGAGRVPDSLPAASIGGVHHAGGLQYFAHRPDQRKKPHDALSQCGATAGASGGLLHWEPDPYLVITDAGRLVWIVDGYTSSSAHPYSTQLNLPAFGGRTNYVRNAVKATVDAYDGTVDIYIFQPGDPIIQAYRNLFPKLFKSESEMPASLRQHARYPALMFEIQAEIYRTFHMRDPEVFYNKEDVWDVAKSLFGDTGTAAPMKPTYIVATLPAKPNPNSSSCCRLPRVTKTT